MCRAVTNPNALQVLGGELILETNMLKTFTTAAALTALMAGGAMAQDDMMIDADENAMEMSMADGQTTVTFPRITARQDGYIVLHAVADGEPVAPESLGHAMVMAGENMGVAVTVPMALAAGTELVAMLHAETNGNGVYDFGPGMTDVDTPVLVNGAPVTAMFTVPEGMAVDTDGDMMLSKEELVAAFGEDGAMILMEDDTDGDAMLSVQEIRIATSTMGDTTMEPEARAESDDAEDPDYRDTSESPIQTNNTETEGFVEEGEDGEGDAGDEDDGQ